MIPFISSGLDCALFNVEEGFEMTSNQEIHSFPINRLVMLHSQGLSGNNILFLQ